MISLAILILIVIAIATAFVSASDSMGTSRSATREFSGDIEARRAFIGPNHRA
jgi:hypothetical protein